MSGLENQMERPESPDGAKLASRVIDSWPRWKQEALASVFGVSFSALRRSANCQTTDSSPDDPPETPNHGI